MSGVSINLLVAKTRVAPLKSLTIPRLELLSCLLLAELLKSVFNALDYLNHIEIFCWSDSEISLCRIKGTHKQWTSWVENRVVKIRSVVSPSHWAHVPGIWNPADIGTRSISPDDMKADSVWFSGPKFLYRSKDYWPKSEVPKDSTDHELKIETTAVTVNITDQKIETVLPIEKYSGIHRLLMVVARIFRFMNNMLSQLKNSKPQSG